jgi:hypothetical protein
MGTQSTYETASRVGRKDLEQEPISADGKPGA